MTNLRFGEVLRANSVSKPGGAYTDAAKQFAEKNSIEIVNESGLARLLCLRIRSCVAASMCRGELLSFN